MSNILYKPPATWQFFSAFQAWFKRINAVTLPEAELRQTIVETLPSQKLTAESLMDCVEKGLILERFIEECHRSL